MRSILVLAALLLPTSETIGQQNDAPEECQRAIEAMTDWRSQLSNRWVLIGYDWETPENAGKPGEREDEFIFGPGRAVVKCYPASKRQGKVSETYAALDKRFLAIDGEMLADLGFEEGRIEDKDNALEAVIGWTGGRYFLSYSLPFGGDLIGFMERLNWQRIQGSDTTAYRGESEKGTAILQLGPTNDHPNGVAKLKCVVKFRQNDKNYQMTKTIQYVGRVRRDQNVLPYRLLVTTLVTGDDYRSEASEKVELRNVASSDSKFENWSDVVDIPNGLPMRVNRRAGYEWRDGQAVIATSDK